VPAHGVAWQFAPAYVTLPCLEAIDGHALAAPIRAYFRGWRLGLPAHAAQNHSAGAWAGAKALQMQQSITFREAFKVWCRVAAQSFGGPTGQIAVMHRVLVDEKKWISEGRFLHALNYCMLLPGPEAQQLATYIGWLLHGTLGGIVAGGLFILPGVFAILGLSVLYVLYHDVTLVAAVFFGLKPAVLAIVVEAVLRIGRRALKNHVTVAIAAAAFVAIFFLQAPFPAIVLTAGIVGLVGGRIWPHLFCAIKEHGSNATTAGVVDDAALRTSKPTLVGSLLVATTWLAIWFLPLFVTWTFLGRQHILVDEGIFFSKAATVTFGGAYAVLPYVAQQAVERFEWLTATEMLDGLGMAETTPGPLIMVVQFVGFLGAYRHPGGFEPLVAAVLGSLLTTWVTFAPSFLWIFLGAPYVERLRGMRVLSAGLSAITAAVVGVILNLAVWFAVHVLFGEVTEVQWRGVHWLAVEPASLDIGAAAIAVVAALSLFVFKRGMLETLGLAVFCGVLWRTATTLG
jgi:chromate transporter